MYREAWQIALLFTAMNLGGTYLSGSEWLRSFAAFGSWGAIGIALTSLTLGWFCHALLRYCDRNGINSLHDLFHCLFGPKWAPSLSVLVHFVLITYAGATVALLAREQAGGAHAFWYLAVPCLLALLLARKGVLTLTRGIAVALAASLLLLFLALMKQPHVPLPSLLYQPNVYWAVYAGFYTALHLLLCTTILLSILNRGTSVHTLCLGVGIGSVLFFAVTMLGYAVLLAFWHEINTSSSPLRDIFSQLMPFGPLVQTAVALAHNSLVLGLLYYAIAIPIAERNDLKLTPMFIVLLLSTLLFALPPLWSEHFAVLAISAATYSGLLLAARFCLARKK